MGICLLIFSLFVLVWGFWDFSPVSRSIPILPINMQLTTSEALKTDQPSLASALSQAPAIPEDRWLSLEWPSTIRVGDSNVIRMSLEMSEAEKITPTAQVEGREIHGETARFPNLYATHNVIAEARLDISGLQVAPAYEIVETLRPGKAVRFYWSIRSYGLGTFQGTVWLHLHFISTKGEIESQLPITAQRIEIRSVSFLGLGGFNARLLGSMGTLAGSVLGLDPVISWLWKLVGRKSLDSG
jgi:hypothetical protein